MACGALQAASSSAATAHNPTTCRRKGRINGKLDIFSNRTTNAQLLSSNAIVLRCCADPSNIQYRITPI